MVLLADLERLEGLYRTVGEAQAEAEELGSVAWASLTDAWHEMSDELAALRAEAERGSE